MLKNSKTEKKTVENFGLLWNNVSEKKCESHSEHTKGLLGFKDKVQRNFFPQWRNTGILEAYFLRLYSVLPEADTSEYSIHNFLKYFMHSKDISLDIIVHSTCACYSKY